jgi:hypothetical protein
MRSIAIDPTDPPANVEITAAMGSRFAISEGAHSSSLSPSRLRSTRSISTGLASQIAPRSRTQLTQPDFSTSPYNGGPGLPFEEDKEVDILWDEMDPKVQELYIVCIHIAGFLNRDSETLKHSILFRNIIQLGSERVEEIRLSSYGVAWKLLTGRWAWDELLKEQHLVQTVKDNLRNSQLAIRLDGSSDMMLSLGFTDDYFYPSWK